MNTTTATQLPVDVEALMRALRLPHARAIAADVLATARAQRWDPTEVIKALLTEETAGRARSMLASRRKAAGFPTGKTFDVWDPNASSIPLPTQQALQTLEWVRRRENLQDARRPHDLRNRRRRIAADDLLNRRRARKDAERAADGGVGVDPVAPSLHHGNDQHAQKNAAERNDGNGDAGPDPPWPIESMRFGVG